MTENTSHDAPAVALARQALREADARLSGPAGASSISEMELRLKATLAELILHAESIRANNETPSRAILERVWNEGHAMGGRSPFHQKPNPYTEHTDGITSLEAQRELRERYERRKNPEGILFPGAEPHDVKGPAVEIAARVHPWWHRMGTRPMNCGHGPGPRIACMERGCDYCEPFRED